MAALLACGALCAATDAPAAAAAGTPLLVTFVSRVCPEYTDVTANRARNDLQESLRDLGENTPYKEDEPINPVIEAEYQPNCKPLPHWEFTFGEGIIARAVSGYWGSLSIVTGETRAPVETLPSVPLLDAQGKPTGESIEGAVTVELDAHEAALAAEPYSLWVQGGTPAEPILQGRYPGEYGFAALRCAMDNENGDNVEMITFPQGETHVWCFAYYIQPPPTAGEIEIRKKVVGTSSGAPETFTFDGNISFNSGGTFSQTITPPATEAGTTFVRAETLPGEAPWRAHEQVPANWRLAGVSCTSASGESSFTTSTTSAEALITLAPLDHATCTFEDEFVPPGGHLTIRKTTIGGTGRFEYKVATYPPPPTPVFYATADTTEEGVAVDAAPSLVSVPVGEYEIAETSPTGARGTWRSTAIGCDNGDTFTPGTPIHVKVASEVSLACTYTNTLEPTASLKLQKRTEGGTGEFGFAVTSKNRPGEPIHQRVDVTREGDVFDAAGEPTNALFFEPYVVQETPPPPNETGHWELVKVTCDGEELPFAEGAAIVDLSEADAAKTCLFTNRFVKGDTPPGPPDDTASVSVTKVADHHTIRLGEKVGYTIRVTGRGAATAREVVLDDHAESRATLVSVKTSQGSCVHKLPLECRLGSIAKGATATIHVVVIPHHTGAFVNRAAVGLGNPDPDFARDEARARVLVRARRRLPHHKPSFTG